MTQRLRFGSFLLACTGMATGCAVSGHWLWVWVIVVFALAGWLLLWKTRADLGLWVFLVFQVSAAAGLLSGLSFWAMLTAMIAALAF